MTLARVVTFDGVDQDRIAEMKREMEGSERPEGVPASEMMVLHDPEASKAVAILFFENEDDYRTADRTLNAMSPEETPGTRASVGKYQVAVRMTSATG